MKKSLSALLLLAFLSVGFQTQVSEPPEVEIILTDGMTLTGYVLAVRDTSIVIAAGTSQGFAVLPHRRILTVQTAGGSYVLIGLASGCAVGALTGFLCGSAQETQPDQGCHTEEQQRHENEMTGFVIGTAVGSLLGLAIGLGASHSGTVLISPAQRDFRILRGVARYPDSEPEFLKSTVP